jgi:hypothetical protein
MALYGVRWIIAAFCQAALLGVYGLVSFLSISPQGFKDLFELVQISVCASLWLLLRTRLWRTFSQVSRGLRREAEILLDGPTDVERPA